MTEAFDKTVFAENLNTKFSVRVDGNKTVELELTEITESNSAPNHEQFAVAFRGPADVYLPQQIYPLEHQRMGTMSVFLVPVGRDEQGFEYEAIFTRVIS
ncbi:MAG: hypothetical protein QOI77_3023 [Blastocatellia bacterium]|nr:hypothetical protein [Blastocatellia bacterium]